LPVNNIFEEKRVMRIFLLAVMIPVLSVVFSGCNRIRPDKTATNDTIMMKLNDFATFALTTDISRLTENEKKMIPLLIEAAKIMDDIYWQEAYGNKDSLLETLKSDELKKLALINYGPWERLNDNTPFIKGIGPKPTGANFYPADMTIEEFESFQDEDKSGLYSLIRRNEQGELVVIPYYKAFSDQVARVSSLLLEAAQLADDPGLKKYLTLRSKAFLDDDYLPSDMAWMDMRNNTIDFVIGPIETYEDQLFGYKASHEAYILIKDIEWSKKLARYAALLPDLQRGLPVDEKYKTEVPGNSSDLGAYEVIYYAGDCNAGSKTIAINLPNDERVQQAKGSRRLQLKNAMQAKFDKILIPIAGILTPQDHLAHVTFDAFFSNTMFHEIAHGLGAAKTINDKGTVREALKEYYSTIEEEKADILGLYLETRLQELGEADADLLNSYTTFMAGIFRSIRFGAASAHGKANLITFNYFKEKEAFTTDSAGRYMVNFERMKEAVSSLSGLILTIQGDGDYEKAANLIRQYGIMDEELKSSLKRVEDQDIPVDIVFEQGLGVIGL
jgi:hypothetical protein